MEPFVWLTSKMTQLPSKPIYVRLERYVRKKTPTLTNLWCMVLMYNCKCIYYIFSLRPIELSTSNGPKAEARDINVRKRLKLVIHWKFFVT